MARDIRECEAYGSDFAVGPTQRALALEQRLPLDLLHELQNQMYTTYAQNIGLCRIVWSWTISAA